MSCRPVWFVSLVLLLILTPSATADTFLRHYEASSTYAYGGGHLGGAPCMGGQDTLVDTGGCVPYVVPGTFDFRGAHVLVTVEDLLFGSDTWIVVVVDMDDDGRSECDGPDLCFQGQGAAVGQIPADAGGRFVRAFPVTLHTDGLGGIPDGSASRGKLWFTFT